MSQPDQNNIPAPAKKKTAMDNYPQTENILNNDQPLVRLTGFNVNDVIYYQQKATQHLKPYEDSDQWPGQFACNEADISGIKADKSTLVLDSDAKDINISNVTADSLIIQASSPPLLSSRSVTISNSHFKNVFIFGKNKISLMNVEIASGELATHKMGILPKIEIDNSPFSATPRQQRAMQRAGTPYNETEAIKHAIPAMK